MELSRKEDQARQIFLIVFAKKQKHAIGLDCLRTSTSFGSFVRN